MLGVLSLLGALAAAAAPAPQAATCGHPPLPAHIIEAKWPESHYTVLRPYVTAIFSVGANGRVRAVRIVDSTGNPKWDRAALSTAKQWTFEPARANCRAIAGKAEYTVGFGTRDYVYGNPCEHEAGVLDAVQPEFPASAKGIGDVSVIVEMALDEHGRVMGLHLKQGVQESEDLNRAALLAATRSVYAPAAHLCLPVPAHVDFKATFSG